MITKNKMISKILKNQSIDEFLNIGHFSQSVQLVAHECISLLF